MKLKISPFAENDLQTSIDYYNDQKESLGYDFAEKVSVTFEKIKKNPYQFPKKYNQMRKARTNKFPFNIFLIEKENTAYIIGIFHSSRDPKIMKNRFNKQ